MTRLARQAAVGMALLWMTAAGCADDNPDPIPDASADAKTGGDGSTDGGSSDGNKDGGSGDGTASSGDGPVSALYRRLGEADGVRKVVTDLVDNRLFKDPKINGYFLNASVDRGHLIDCLVLQIGALSGGPQVYPSNGCRDMKTAHAGLKISMQDFSDLATHLVAAFTAASVAPADINAIVAAVTPSANDIIEDPTNNGTVYQRVGRKPALSAVIDMFIAKVTSDARINGFFSATNAMRLKTCLTRQVCAIDGPCRYGQEITNDSEPGVSPANVCRDMKTTHTGVTKSGSTAIAKGDFDALVDDLVMVLTAAKVGDVDKAAILAGLAPTCDDVVAGGTGCPGRKILALTSTNTLVAFDSKTPMSPAPAVTVTGLSTLEKLVGIAFRPANGKLYGLGNGGRIYTINPATGAATGVGNAFTPALSGTQFGFDFNPNTDRARVVSDTQQNLRVDPNTGLAVDADFFTKGVQIDTALNQAGAAISAIAHSNNTRYTPKTTLYGIDVNGNKLVRIGGPDGTPSPDTGMVSDVGPLGVDPTSTGGFDIAPASNQLAFAALNVGGTAQLYAINVATGAATVIGPIGSGLTVTAIAIAP